MSEADHAIQEYPETLRGLLLLAVGLVLGVIGDQLFPGVPWGLNLGFFFTGLLAAAWLLNRSEGRATILLLLPFMVAWAFAWRDSIRLLLMDTLALLLALGIALFRPRSGSWRSVGWGELVRGAAWTIGEVLTGPFTLLKEIPWQQLREREASKHVKGVAFGLLLSLPLVLVFGTLFASADARFEALIEQLGQIDPMLWLAHSIFAGFLAWLSVGFLRAFLRGVPDPGEGELAKSWTLELATVATVLLVLDLLFALFVGYQLPYLFGGLSLVQTAPGMTLASYARRGFGELTVVSALVLPLLLGLRALLGTLEPRGAKVFRWLAGLLLALLSLIIVSALHRMLIYQAEYGLTVRRVYVFAFEIWLFGAIAWFAWTVLRDRQEQLIGGMLAWAFAGLAFMHVPNWEAMIVRTNTARALAGKELDIDYLNHLSLDAVPALVEAQTRLPQPTRDQLAGILKGCQESLDSLDWRSGSLSRLAAARALSLPPLESKSKNLPRGY